MWINVNGKWHFVTWTDPNYVSFHGEMLHKTLCGLLKIRISYADYPDHHVTCKRCVALLRKDVL